MKSLKSLDLTGRKKNCKLNFVAGVFPEFLLNNETQKELEYTVRIDNRDKKSTGY